jgi:uncharacterized coiled-coil protein SlyX
MERGVPWPVGLMSGPSIPRSHTAMDAACRARYPWGVDAELKAYLDGMVETITMRIAEQGSRLDALGAEMREGFIAVNERFRTLEQRIDQFEARVNGQLGALNAELAGVKRGVAQIERRVTNLEDQSVATNARLDGLHLDMRQRFRVLTDRVGAIENLLAA